MSVPSSACEMSGAAIIDAIAIILSMILTSIVSAVILRSICKTFLITTHRIVPLQFDTPTANCLPKIKRWLGVLSTVPMKAMMKPK